MPKCICKLIALDMRPCHVCHEATRRALDAADPQRQQPNQTKALIQFEFIAAGCWQATCPSWSSAVGIGRTSNAAFQDLCIKTRQASLQLRCAIPEWAHL